MATRLRSSEARVLAFGLGLVRTALQGLDVVMEGSVAQARSSLGRLLLLLCSLLPGLPRDDSRRWWCRWWLMEGGGEAIAMFCVWCFQVRLSGVVSLQSWFLPAFEIFPDGECVVISLGTICLGEVG